MRSARSCLCRARPLRTGLGGRRSRQSMKGYESKLSAVLQRRESRPRRHTHSSSRGSGGCGALRIGCRRGGRTHALHARNPTKSGASEAGPSGRSRAQRCPQDALRGDRFLSPPRRRDPPAQYGTRAVHGKAVHGTTWQRLGAGRPKLGRLPLPPARAKVALPSSVSASPWS